MIHFIHKNAIAFSAKFFLICFAITVTSCSKNSVPSPAENTLKRVLGNDASRFELVLQKSNDTLEWFETHVENDKIHIKANSAVALCKGAYTYIIDNGYGVISWEGSNVSIPEKLEDKKYDKVTVSVPLRMYLNPCTYGYTMAWWNWERWEKELDWMAMHGINMPISLSGQEIIWQQVWEEMGIEKSKLADYYSGPAFLPWFRMGNIYNHTSTLPQNFMEKDGALQKKIMDRMQELGMHPIVPSFSGHVPPFFVEKYPNSKTYKLEDWGGLEKEKASYLLDPKDSLFTVIGKKFLKKYEATYGKADLFLADAFNEMLPPVSEENKDVELAEYGKAIYQGIKEHNPKATWVLQGWTFGHQGYFWTPKSTAAFLSEIPKENVLMLNYGEDRYSIWKKLEGFYGYKWTYGYVHNYGGQQSLFGDFNLYYTKYKDLIDNPQKKNLVGYGCLPEAIENNSIVYDYIFDVPWGGTELTINNWVNRYIKNRYGKLTSKVEKAWDIALKNTYTVKEWRTNSLGYGTYIHNNRPSLHPHENMIHGNPKSMAPLLKLLLEEYQDYDNSELYFYDIIDFAQHYTACLADLHLIKATRFYKEMDFDKGDVEFEKTKDYLKKLEVLQVYTGGSFTKWCEDAISHATSEDEKALFLRNAKTQIGIWGGNRLKDYASKSWSGILTDYYIPRWQMLFDAAKQEKENFDETAAKDRIRIMEEKWAESSSIPQSPEVLSKKEYLELVKGLVQ